MSTYISPLQNIATVKITTNEQLIIKMVSVIAQNTYDLQSKYLRGKMLFKQCNVDKLITNIERENSFRKNYVSH